jgi:hypothetical protein
MSRPLRIICWALGYGVEIAAGVAIPWGTLVFLFDVFTGASLVHAAVWGMFGLGAAIWLIFGLLKITELLVSATNTLQARFKLANLLDELHRSGHEQISAKTIVNTWYENQPTNERLRLLQKTIMYNELRRAVANGHIHADRPLHTGKDYNCEIKSVVSYFRRISNLA